MDAYNYGKKLAELRKQHNIIKNKELLVSKKLLKFTDSYDKIYARVLKHKNISHKLKDQLAKSDIELEFYVEKLKEWEDGLACLRQAIAEIKDDISNNNANKAEQRRKDLDNMAKTFTLMEVSKILDLKHTGNRIKGWAIDDTKIPRQHTLINIAPENYETLDEVRDLVWQQDINNPSDNLIEWERVFFSAFLTNPQLSFFANKSLRKNDSPRQVEICDGY